MNSNINLIAKDSDEIVKKLKRLRLVRLIAVSCMSFVTITSIVVFILNASVPISTIKNNQAVALSNFSSVKDKAAKYYLEKNRLSNISLVINKRKNYVSNIEHLTNILSPGLSINSISVDSGSSMSVTVIGSSLDSFGTFLDELVNLVNQGAYFKSLNIQNFTLNTSDGTYSLFLQSKLL